MDSHKDRTLTIHFQLKLQMRRNFFAGTDFNLIRIESGDQLEIMITQTILVIVFKCSPEKQLFFLEIGKFIYKTFIDRFSFPHMLKGF